MITDGRLVVSFLFVLGGFRVGAGVGAGVRGLENRRRIAECWPSVDNDGVAREEARGGGRERRPHGAYREGEPGERPRARVGRRGRCPPSWPPEARAGISRDSVPSRRRCRGSFPCVAFPGGSEAGDLA